MGRIGEYHPINRALGITPTVDATWGTAPANLGNATDNDWSTFAGTGQKVLGGAGAIGKVYLDLGAEYAVMVRLKVGIWSTANSVLMTVYMSQDGVTWYGNGISDTSFGVVAERIINLGFVHGGMGRYVGLFFYGLGAMTANVKIYEVQAIEFPEVSGVP